VKLRVIVMGLVLSALWCFGADVDGKWTGTMNTPMGDVPVNFNFKADGAKLTGTTSGPEGDVQISNGKVDGDKLTFSVNFDFGGMAVTLNYSGVLNKDEIKFMIDVFGMPLDLTVKRAG
jgi:hypothetical protein